MADAMHVLLPLLLILCATPSAAPTAMPAPPVLRSAPVSNPDAEPEPAEVPEAWVDLAETTTTGEPEFIDTDPPDGGSPAEAPRLPLPPKPLTGRPRRAQAATPPPPASLARDLDPAVTEAGCVGWSSGTQTAACIEGQHTAVAGGHVVLTLLGQLDEPYLLWTTPPERAGEQPIPGDPAELEEARARLAALALMPLGPPLVLDGPAREFLTAAAPAWLVWKKARVGTTGGVDLERHTVMVTCGLHRARIFQTDHLDTNGSGQRARVWLVDAGRTLVADFTRTWVTSTDRGRTTRAVVVDLERLCRRRP